MEDRQQSRLDKHIMSDNGGGVDGNIITDVAACLNGTERCDDAPAPIDEDSDTNAFGEITDASVRPASRAFSRSFILVVGSPTAMVTAEPGMASSSEMTG